MHLLVLIQKQHGEQQNMKPMVWCQDYKNAKLSLCNSNPTNFVYWQVGTHMPCATCDM